MTATTVGVVLSNSNGIVPLLMHSLVAKAMGIREVSQCGPVQCAVKSHQDVVPQVGRLVASVSLYSQALHLRTVCFLLCAQCDPPVCQFRPLRDERDGQVRPAQQNAIPRIHSVRLLSPPDRGQPESPLDRRTRAECAGQPASAGGDRVECASGPTTPALLLRGQLEQALREDPVRAHAVGAGESLRWPQVLHFLHPGHRLRPPEASRGDGRPGEFRAKHFVPLPGVRV